MNPSPCLLCGQPLQFNPRYPRAVCAGCAQRACDASGRPLAFFNADMGGGFTAVYRDTGAPYDSHICWIGNTRCYADEAHLGGIVVQVE